MQKIGLTKGIRKDWDGLEQIEVSFLLQRIGESDLALDKQNIKVILTRITFFHSQERLLCMIARIFFRMEFLRATIELFSLRGISNFQQLNIGQCDSVSDRVDVTTSWRQPNV